MKEKLKRTINYRDKGVIIYPPYDLEDDDFRDILFEVVKYCEREDMIYYLFFNLSRTQYSVIPKQKRVLLNRNLVRTAITMHPEMNIVALITDVFLKTQFEYIVSDIDAEKIYITEDYEKAIRHLNLEDPL